MKKPDIFKPIINHDLNNNKSTYYSFIETGDLSNNLVKDEKPVDTLDRLIRNSSYVFNKKVLIITRDKEYLTSIAGKIGKRVITLDGDSINIEDIVKIEEK